MSRSNPWKKRPRHTRHTTLIVVEGDTEKAFIQHLKNLCGRDCGSRIKIENAHGGDGNAVLKQAIKLCPSFNACLCLYDGDRKATIKKNLKQADRLKIKQVVSIPCIEGFLLEILNRPVPRESASCKKALHDHLNIRSLTSVQAFQKHFPEQLLRMRKDDIPDLRKIFETIGQ